MKKHIFLLSILFSTFSLAANELAWVDEQVQAIKPPREGMNPNELEHLKDPFIFLKIEEEEKKTLPKKIATPKHIVHKVRKRGVYHKRFSLEAIMNKSVLINGKWYKEGQKIAGYTIKQVHPTTVILKKGKRELQLSTKSKNKNLKIKNN